MLTSLFSLFSTSLASVMGFTPRMHEPRLTQNRDKNALKYNIATDFTEMNTQSHPMIDCKQILLIFFNNESPR